MNIYRYRAFGALTAAGVAWGLTVPMSKIALEWMGPGWLAFVRFGLAAAALVAVAAATPQRRRRLRRAFRLPVLASGALGYGATIALQNAGIARTSITHAALLSGAAPVLVAVIALVWQRSAARPVAWAGFALSLAGAGVVTGGHSGGATPAGDALVLGSVVLMAAGTVAQARFVADLDAVAVTAVQFVGAAVATLPLAAAEGLPSAPAGAGAVAGLVLSAAGLAVAGTLLPFTLYGYGQRHVSAEVAGAFLNLEPFVGAISGIALFGEPAGPRQLAGGAAILIGVALGSLPGLMRSREVSVPVAAGDSGPLPADVTCDTFRNSSVISRNTGFILGTDASGTS